MNKHLHRIVFNAARGLRMAVQETARSAGKAASGATTLGITALATLAAAPAWAQIAADPNAPGQQRPTVLAAPSGAALVNIQTPSAAGVSRNLYRQFDVGTAGAVLNNSRGSAQTRLAGQVPGNPWLAQGPARIILNEVNSADPSRLRGFVEVAGQRAEVIIANPAGIQVDGAGFINASRATLTTGRPRFDAAGSLQGFLVQGGTIAIEGAGLDASKTDYTAILARALQVNAGIWANELKVVAGAAQVSAESGQATAAAATGSAPVFALDVAALGGMYAGKITLIGTETGVGVRNAGSIGAGTGELVVTAAGRLENTGTLESGRIELVSGEDIHNRGGRIHQAGAVDLQLTAAAVRNSSGGQIGTAALADPGLPGTTPPTESGSAPAPSPVATLPGSLRAAGTIHNDGGRIEAGGAIALQTSRLDNHSGAALHLDSLAFAGERFSNAGGTLNVANAFSADVGLFENQGGMLRAATIAITATGALDNTGGTLASQGSTELRVGGALRNAHGVLSTPGSLRASVAGMLDNAAGQVQAGRLQVTATGDVDNRQGTLTGVGAADLAVGGNLLNRRGTLASTGSLLATVGTSLDNAGGSLQAERIGMAVQGDLDNRDGTLSSNGPADLVVGGAAHNARGTLSAAGSLRLDIAGTLDNSAGTVLGNDALAVTAGALDNTQGALQSAHGATQVATAGQLSNHVGHVGAGTDLSVRAGSLANTGLLRGGNDSRIAVTGVLSNTAGISAGRHATITAGSLVNGTTGVLAAGALSTGHLADTGDLNVTAAGALTVAGTALAAGQATLRGASADLTSAQVSGAHVMLAATNGDVTTRNATVATDGTLKVVADGAANQWLDNAAGTLRAGRLDLQAANIRNTQDGRIVQTGTASTAIAVNGTLDNSSGLLASNGQDLRLAAGTLHNVHGALQHAGSGTLQLDAGHYDGRHGEITANGKFVAQVAGALRHDGATLTAAQVAIDAGSLGNAGGSIVQTGTQAARIAAAGTLDNSAGGRIASNGNLTIAAESLRNHGGNLRSAGGASLAIDTTGLLDNSSAGTIGSAGDLRLGAATFTNDAGSVTAVGPLHVTAAGAFSNLAGTLAANGNATLSAASLDNTGGSIASARGDLAITTAGSTVNTAGTVQAAGATTLVNAGLVNTRGKVTGTTLSVDTQGATLANALGTLAATATLGLQSGALDNDKGLIQSGAAMAIDTHGQVLTNTHAAGHSSGQGGIASGAALTLAAGTTDNTAGFIGAASALSARTGAFANAAGGLVLGRSDVSIGTQGAAYDNRGGQTLALGDLGIDAGSGTVHNSGALLRSAGRTTVGAGVVDNQATLGTDQGIEGREVVISATVMNNHAGAVRADADIGIHGSASVDNTHGLLSAGGTLSILDANPGAKALALANSGGTVVARNGLHLDVATFSGDGALTSGRDLSISLAQDLVNHATVRADGNLHYASTGTLTNHGKLLAGQTLSVAGRDVENTASGEMRGNTTVVRASGTLTNHGLIDGHDTRIDAGVLVNAPTGRIYGDDLSIAAGSLVNAADGSSAGAIAARDSLHIGAGTVTNQPDALIFSAGDLHMGGALDAARQAMGAAALVENQAATIEALGDLNIHAATLRNLNGGVTTTTSTRSEHVVEFGLVGSPERWRADEVLITTGISLYGDFIGWTAVPGHAPDTGNDDPGPRLLLPSPDYPLARFAAYYAASPATSSDKPTMACTGGEGGECVPAIAPGAWYGVTDPIWATFGVAPPARDLPANHPLRLDPNATVGQIGTFRPIDEGQQELVTRFDHPVTEAEFEEGRAYRATHAALDAATERFVRTIVGGNLAGVGRLPSRLHKEYNVWDYTVTQSTPSLQSSSAARILAGGDMTLTVGAGTNDMSQILASGALTVQGGSIDNKAVEAQVTTAVDGVAMHTYIKTHTFQSDDRRYDVTTYNPVTPPSTVTLAAARLEGGASLGGLASGQATAGAQAVRVTAATQAAGAVQPGPRVNPIVEVPAATGGTPGLTGTTAQPNAPGADPTRTTAAAPESLVVRTSTPNATVPQASLYRTTAEAGSRYLVQTDPAFANDRTWLSSDYLLGALGHDPAMMAKRLGDGFYEQRLVREQVAQLTGYRYLAGAHDDHSQNAALMDAGATFAQAYQLTPGVALSAEQMAQLTSDIVWLVEQSVTLADGSSQRVLVPQVYVRVRPGDIDGSGALLSADALRIQNAAGQGDLINRGTLAGRTLVALSADNVHNLGGRITGASVGVNARTDLANIGGTIEAQNAAVGSPGTELEFAL